MSLTLVIVTIWEQSPMNDESSLVLEYDHHCLELSVKDAPKNNTLLQSMPLLLMVGTILGISFVCLRGQLLHEW